MSDPTALDTLVNTLPQATVSTLTVFGVVKSFFFDPLMRKLDDIEFAVTGDRSAYRSSAKRVPE